uniref:Uncharacterized protein n=1 Tax=Sicyonia whispovirus TaxID=2984283 RepID=A0A9C7CFZ5_9VIRU|nr:MAG: hypothetical protein [Sicyonia whispovirus]
MSHRVITVDSLLLLVYFSGVLSGVCLTAALWWLVHIVRDQPPEALRIHRGANRHRLCTCLSPPGRSKGLGRLSTASSRSNPFQCFYYKCGRSPPSTTECPEATEETPVDTRTSKLEFSASSSRPQESPEEYYKTPRRLQPEESGYLYMATHKQRQSGGFVTPTSHALMAAGQSTNDDGYEVMEGESSEEHLCIHARPPTPPMGRSRGHGGLSTACSRSNPFQCIYYKHGRSPSSTTECPKATKETPFDTRTPQLECSASSSRPQESPEEYYKTPKRLQPEEPGYLFMANHATNKQRQSGGFVTPASHAPVAAGHSTNDDGYEVMEGESSEEHLCIHARRPTPLQLPDHLRVSGQGGSCYTSNNSE